VPNRRSEKTAEKGSTYTLHARSKEDYLYGGIKADLGKKSGYSLEGEILTAARLGGRGRKGGTEGNTGLSIHWTLR